MGVVKKRDMAPLSARDARGIARAAQAHIDHVKAMEKAAKAEQRQELLRRGVEIFLPLCFSHARLKAEQAHLECELVIYPHLKEGTRAAEQCLTEDQDSHPAEDMIAIELTEAAAPLMEKSMLDEVCETVCESLCGEPLRYTKAEHRLDPVSLIKNHYRVTFHLGWRDE
jgi:hypothetical protein